MRVKAPLWSSLYAIESRLAKATCSDVSARNTATEYADLNTWYDSAVLTLCLIFCRTGMDGYRQRNASGRRAQNFQPPFVYSNLEQITCVLEGLEESGWKAFMQALLEHMQVRVQELVNPLMPYMLAMRWSLILSHQPSTVCSKCGVLVLVTGEAADYCKQCQHSTSLWEPNVTF